MEIYRARYFTITAVLTGSELARATSLPAPFKHRAIEFDVNVLWWVCWLSKDNETRDMQS